MRFMLIVKANPESEAGVMPTGEELAEMGKFNEELVNAGVMLAGEGLHASSRGARVRFGAGAPVVTDGPFPEATELVAGFWIIRAASKREALEWVKKVPFKDGEIEVRQIAETEDFAESDPTGELRRAEHELRARVEKRQ